MGRRGMETEERQRLFLVALGEWGTIHKACRVMDMTRWAYRTWVAEDPGFSQRVDGAKVDFGESLEDIALDRIRNPDKGKGSDILLIGLLNANLPHKYRPAAALDHDSAKELIVEWRKAVKQVKVDDGPVEDGLPAPIERTLAEILEKRGNVAGKGEGQEGDHSEHEEVKGD
jgi:hypothetical protein